MLARDVFEIALGRLAGDLLGQGSYDRFGQKSISVSNNCIYTEQ
jgi:hypothetical protein